MSNTLGPLLLCLLILPSALPQQACVSRSAEIVELSREIKAAAVGVTRQIEKLLVDFTELVKIVQVTQNSTSQLLFQCNSSQLLIDLQTLRGLQAVSGAVQVGQVLMFVAYLLTIAVLYMVKHCNKHRERLAQSEFELLEAKLQANKAKRRAASARAKSAPQTSPK